MWYLPVSFITSLYSSRLTKILSEILTDVCFFFSYREQALTEATNKPLFSKASRSLRGVVKYPYVFDSLLAAQQSGAYVGGCKVCIFSFYLYYVVHQLSLVIQPAACYSLDS